jgi:hypothetical protein
VSLLAIIFFSSCRAPKAQQAALSQSIAKASAAQLSARYVLDSDWEPPALGQEAGELAMRQRLQRLFGKGSMPIQTLAWSPATGKGAFFNLGFVWLADSKGAMRSIWYEPDLKAEGHMEWNSDGTLLRLHADGWRHWMNLEIKVD